MEAQEHHTPRSTLPPTATNENNSRRPIEAQLITVWSLEVGVAQVMQRLSRLAPPLA